MPIVNCENIDKIELLKHLWRNSQTAAFFNNFPVSPPSEPKHQEFADAVENYVDYLGGRVIKTNFTKFPELDPWGYDRDNGTGAMQRIVDQFRG